MINILTMSELFFGVYVFFEKWAKRLLISFKEITCNVGEFCCCSAITTKILWILTDTI